MIFAICSLFKPIFLKYKRNSENMVLGVIVDSTQEFQIFGSIIDTFIHSLIFEIFALGSQILFDTTTFDSILSFQTEIFVSESLFDTTTLDSILSLQTKIFVSESLFIQLVFQIV